VNVIDEREEHPMASYQSEFTYWVRRRERFLVEAGGESLEAGGESPIGDRTRGNDQDLTELLEPAAWAVASACIARTNRNGAVSPVPPSAARSSALGAPCIQR
jgi:hypothetical protein